MKLPEGGRLRPGSAVPGSKSRSTCYRKSNTGNLNDEAIVRCERTCLKIEGSERGSKRGDVKSCKARRSICEREVGYFRILRAATWGVRRESQVVKAPEEQCARSFVLIIACKALRREAR